MEYAEFTVPLPLLFWWGQREHKKAGVEIFGSTVDHPKHGNERQEK